MASEPTFIRRDFGLAGLAFAGLALGAMALPSVAPAQAQQKPNIVFILVDNTGWGDWSCYGGTTPTPRIDKTRAFVSTTTTSRSNAHPRAPQ
jgi:arylsulfatase